MSNIQAAVLSSIDSISKMKEANDKADSKRNETEIQREAVQTRFKALLAPESSSVLSDNVESGRDINANND